MAEELVRKDVNLRTAEIDLAAIGDIFLTLGEPFLDVGNLDKRKDLGANAHDWMSLMCQFRCRLGRPPHLSFFFQIFLKFSQNL